MNSPRISPEFARLLSLPEDAEDAVVARRVAELVGLRPPRSAGSIKLLAEVVWHVDAAFVGNVADPIDTAEIADGVINSVGLDLSRREWHEVADELGSDDLPDALMEFAALHLAPQLAYAGLIDLHPPPPQPGDADPWPTIPPGA